MKYHLSTLVLVLILIASCKPNGQDSESNSDQLVLPKKPNILWLVTEDMGPYIPPFGDSTVATPNLSKLASQGVIYTNLYSTSGVCAPSRAAIATGMYPSGIGANHMRTGSYTEVTGLRKYEAVPGPDVKMISELLRSNGYYCTNNYKTDYQFNAPVTAWDESSPYAHWRNRDEGQPFFAVFNFTETHESGLFEPYGHRNIETRHYQSGDRNYEWGPDRMPEEEINVYLSKDTAFPIPPYLPNTPVVRRDMWKMYNNIGEMDNQVGAVLKQLEADGLLENTIVFFYGDHGGPLPRQKRLIYDSGLKTPMIIRFPNQLQAGTKDDQLLSFIDFAPTLLSMIDLAPEDYMDGQAFLGDYTASQERQYIHGAADRFDGFTDAIRAVKDNRFKYIRNYRTDQGYYLPVEYRERIPTMQELLRLKAESKLTQAQAQWFRETKPRDELYDCKVDPHELNNLAENPEYAEKLEELSLEMDRWLAEIGDDPDMPEAELIEKLWNGSEEQPVTANPVLSQQNGKVQINSATEGASIGYKIVNNNNDKASPWLVYNQPIDKTELIGELWLQAHRIGYEPSETIKIKL